jgi:uncharacterized coiled-coil protein SlyX
LWYNYTMDSQDIIDELKSEIASQKNEIAQLRSDLELLNGMCKSESENVTDHIKYIYKYLKVLDDRSLKYFELLIEYLVVIKDSVAPLEDKLFPGVSKARKQLAAIVENLKMTVREKNEKRL